MNGEEGVRGQYDDSNRAFTQAFMAHGTLTLRQAQPILAAIFTARGEPTEASEVTQDDFQSYVSASQAALSHFDYEVRSTMHQVRKERVYAIVNTTSDAMTQLATLHSAEEIAFVKRVIDAMFEKYNSPRMEVMALDSLQAIKLSRVPQAAVDEDAEDGETQTQSQLKGIKSSEAEVMMQNMVDEGWFERSDAGLYSLSPRALMELRQWLLHSYNDPDADEDGSWQRIKFCEACKEIVTKGQRCADRDCNVRLHDICQDAFWRARRDQKCPKCRTEWDGKHFVGEKAVTETEAYQKGRRRSGKGGRSSNLMDQIMQDPGDGDEDAGASEP